MEVMQSPGWAKYLKGENRMTQASTLATKDKRQKEKNLEELRGNFYFLSNYNFFQ